MGSCPTAYLLLKIIDLYNFQPDSDQYCRTFAAAVAAHAAANVDAAKLPVLLWLEKPQQCWMGVVN